jgi:hypothetical protein
MRRTRLVALALAATLTLGTVATALAIVPGGLPGAAHAAKFDRVAFHDAMRKLWEDHITWTRLFIVSAATLPDNLPDAGPTAERLFANQDDLGDVFRPFYGDEVGDAVTALLSEHIQTAADIITAAKAGDTAARDRAIAMWYVNANEIADALHGINPKHWPQAEMRAMMKAHLDRTLEEAVARLEGRYTDDIKAYEQIHADILEMADMLSDGIIAQFPNAFRG